MRRHTRRCLFYRSEHEYAPVCGNAGKSSRASNGERKEIRMKDSNPKAVKKTANKNPLISEDILRSVRRGVRWEDSALRIYGSAWLSSFPYQLRSQRHRRHEYHRCRYRDAYGKYHHRGDRSLNGDIGVEHGLSFAHLSSRALRNYRRAFFRLSPGICRGVLVRNQYLYRFHGDQLFYDRAVRRR